MLARRLATILPDMTLDEAVETTRLHRVAGLTGGSRTCVTTRPCRAPHHTIADVSVIGGGQIPMPGEVSRAHRPSLDLDVLSEWVCLLHHPHAPPVAADLCWPHACALLISLAQRPAHSS
jgi:predicted ATPase with chaperone activity